MAETVEKIARRIVANAPEDDIPTQAEQLARALLRMHTLAEAARWTEESRHPRSGKHHLAKRILAVLEEPCPSR